MAKPTPSAGQRIKCFLLEPLEIERVYLRVIGKADCPKKGGGWWCRGRVLLGEFALGGFQEAVPPSDPRWPAVCEWCAGALPIAGELPADAIGGMRVVDHEVLYKRADTGEVLTLDQAPDGAIWRAKWYEDHGWTGADGQTWICRIPRGHDWIIDSRASNCDSPCTCGVPYAKHHAGKGRDPKACDKYVDARPHKCWVRSGTAPDFSATKGKKGESCTAGAGSIKTPEYHGHLRNGELVSC